MPDEPSAENPAPTPEPQPAGAAAPHDQGLWRQMAEATSDEEFCSGWLGLQARTIGGVAGGVVAFERPKGGQMSPTAVWPSDFGHSEVLAGVVERAFVERKGIVVRSDAEAQAGERLGIFMAYPIRIGKKVHAAAAFQISPRSQIQLQSAMRQLQWGAAWLQNWIMRVSAEPSGRPRRSVSTVLELMGLVLEEPRFRSAATAVVTELAARLSCDRVSLGFVSGTQVKVRALSHSAQFGKQMNLIRSIGTAMGESVDQGIILRYPAEGDDGRQILHAHEKLARTHGDGAICTVPFLDAEGEAYGALIFERSVDEPFDDEVVELCDSLAALLGPILDEKRKNDRLLIAKAWDSVVMQVKRLIGPRHALRKVLVSILVILVLFFTFATGEYRIKSETTLEGELRRVVAAPFRGFVFEAKVRGGDLVDAGQLMASLDTRDLKLEYSRWSSEREQYVIEHRRAMAERDRAAMNVLDKKMQQAAAQIALLEDQISRAAIVAPFDGLVVNGDLSQSLGAPVEVGDVLFEVSPLDAYRLVLQVDERDIGEISEGQSGELILTAMPNERFDFTVTKVTPVSRSEEGRNVFRVEGRLKQASDRLRPGMEGFSKVSVDRRKLIWIWTHSLFEWLRIKLWNWLP